MLTLVAQFINMATGQPFAAVGRGLLSCTQEIGVIRYPHPYITGRHVVFVDTPGFDDSGRGDYDILKVLATWLAETYVYSVSRVYCSLVDFFLYLHQI